ncbi:MAG: hypothetical protein LBR76_01790 [Oscillospiraceae bacterium]|nr:hypothetical protein [Oscillospiraceae bacterium]
MILLFTLGALLGVAASVILWQRETIYFIMNPDRIQVKSAGEIQEALYSGEAGGIRRLPDGGLEYSLLGGTVALSVSFEGDSLSRMNAAFNIYSIPVKTVSGALKQAHSVLSPYLGAPEINALCAVIAWEMPGATTSNSMDYRRQFGAYTVSVGGSLVSGDARVTVERSSP